MNVKSKIILAVTCLFFACGIAEAVQVIPQQGSTASRIGEGLAKGLAEGMKKHAEEAAKRREQEYQDEATKREAERREQLARDFIEYYEPERHEFYIVSILESELSTPTKNYIIEHVNKIHESWLFESELIRKLAKKEEGR